MFKHFGSVNFFVKIESDFNINLIGPTWLIKLVILNKRTSKNYLFECTGIGLVRAKAECEIGQWIAE